jgi:hypothetical protein
VLDVSLDYDGQYLLIEARPAPAGQPVGGRPFPLEDDMAALGRAVSHFSRTHADTLATWRGQVRDVRQRGGRAVIWGAGSKGVAYLTALGLDDEIEYAVDINPHKRGMFMAGTGQEIVSPDFLVEYRPDLVVVMNPVYVEEIERDLARLGLNPELVSV